MIFNAAGRRGPAVLVSNLMSDVRGSLMSGGVGASSQGKRGRTELTELTVRPWQFGAFTAKQQAHPAIVDVPTGIPPFDQKRRP
jgi:hypothetical protein